MISNLNITNYKSLRDIDISFSNLNILTGLNGMGKSSILQVLTLLRNSFLDSSGSQSFSFIKLNSEELMLGKKKDILYQSAEDDSITFQLTVADCPEIPQLIFTGDNNRDYLELEPSSKDKVYKFLNNNLQKMQETALFSQKNYQYLCSNLIAPSVLHYKNDYVIYEKDNIGTRGEYAIQYLNEFGAKYAINNILKHPSSNSLSLTINVNAWLSEISPGVSLHISSVSESDSLSLNFKFDTNKLRTNNINPLNVGYGINYVIPIITALLKADKNKMIIIENPETYLHPRGQSKIGELIALAAQTGSQIIIETHSDHVINGIRIATKNQAIDSNNIRLYYFDRDINSDEHYSYVNQINIDKNGRLDHWPKGFMDEWEKNLMELI